KCLLAHEFEFMECFVEVIQLLFTAIVFCLPQHISVVSTAKLDNLLEPLNVALCQEHHCSEHAITNQTFATSIEDFNLLYCQLCFWPEICFNLLVYVSLHRHLTPAFAAGLERSGKPVRQHAIVRL